jgi:hypothetical protein
MSNNKYLHLLEYPRKYKVVQIWPGQTVTNLHTNRPGHIWTTLYYQLHRILYWWRYVCPEYSFHLLLFTATCCRDTEKGCSGNGDQSNNFHFSKHVKTLIVGNTVFVI